MVSSQLRLAFDAHQKRTPATGGHQLAGKVATLEGQSKRALLKCKEKERTLLSSVTALNLVLTVNVNYKPIAGQQFRRAGEGCSAGGDRGCAG